ncbi:MAG: hypothetical protein JSS83_03700 [Cyanobacteria bacterium SZAS LIN-3]|nr:hypothetical protein [Cyanobacteria bacterium SZAS LIN-3]
MRYSSRSRKHQSATLCLSLALLSFGQVAIAQQSNVAGGTSGQPKKATNAPPLKPDVRVPARRASSGPVNDTLSKPEILPADKVVFDDIPQYTGKAKYQTGMVYQQNDAHNSTLMLVTFTASEPREQVKEWYVNALRMYGWNITFQSDTVVNATNSKTGNTVALQLSDPPKPVKPDTRSLFQIDYHKQGKQ